jgi:hypothetical protein
MPGALDCGPLFAPPPPSPHPCHHACRDGNPDALSRAQEEIKTTMQVAASIESLVQKVLGV